MISAKFLWGNVLHRGELQIDAKKKSKILKFLRAPSIWNLGVCLYRRPKYGFMLQKMFITFKIYILKNHYQYQGNIIQKAYVNSIIILLLKQAVSISCTLFSVLIYSWSNTL